MMFYLFIFLTVAFDAWRDAWLGKSWWPRHLVKWAAFYMPILYILWRENYFVWDFHTLVELGLLAGVSFLLWEWVYEVMRKL